ncbi:MAG: TIGR01212 family radical SAM protein [Firmicutes bacterium]|nr:TIGR01212 family radical SAM protein [Bacillota bacterium]
MNAKKRYYSANEFFRNKFSDRIIKIPVDAGFTCPTRDGKISYGGCIFCSERGSGDFAGNRTKTITEQFYEMKEKMSKKWKSGKYMIYFQAFTNTYADTETLRNKYEEAASLENVCAISVATRPDCIDDEIISLLKEINSKIYLCVELGFQTSNEKTAEFLNRGYKNEVFLSCVKKLKENNIDVIAHVIIGLPHETETDILNTISYAANSGIDGIKLQLLHILANTPLADIYEKEKFHILTEKEYVDIIVKCIEHLPPHIVIHRITGDGSRSLLIEPKWSLDKKRVLNDINKTFVEKNTYQGACYIEKKGV